MSGKKKSTKKNFLKEFFNVFKSRRIGGDEVESLILSSYQPNTPKEERQQYLHVVKEDEEEVTPGGQFVLEPKLQKIYENCMLDPKNIFIGKKLTHSQQSTIFDGYIKMGFKKFFIAIKRLSLSKHVTPTSVLTEINIINKCQHDHVLGVIGAWFKAKQAYLALEYCEKGNLQYNIQKIKDNMTMLDKIDILVQIAKGIRAIHNKKYAHLSITSYNCLIGNDAKVKIGSFRNSRVDKKENYKAVIDEIKKGTMVLNPRYLSPELAGYIDIKNLKKCDIYSYGILIWEIMTSGIPFYIFNETHEKMIEIIHKKKVRPGIPALEYCHTPKRIIALCQKCWSHNPTERPNNIEEILVELQSSRADIMQKMKASLSLKGGLMMNVMSSGLMLDADDEKIYNKCYVDQRNLVFGEKIYKRATGCIKKAVLKIGLKEIPCAIKEVSINIQNTPKSVLHEVHVMNSVVEHQNILTCFGMWFEDNSAKLVLELCERGNLSSYLGRHSPLTRIDILSQIARGMSFLHEKGYCHRNLNTTNCLIFYDEDDFDTPVIKICDFKGAKVLAKVTESDFAGRAIFACPEMCGFGKIVDPRQLDVFSFGIIMFEVWSGKLYKLDRKLNKLGCNSWLEKVQRIHSNKIRPEISELKDDAPPLLIELMTMCWEHDPKKRLKSFKVILAKLDEARREISRELKKREIKSNLFYKIDEEDEKIVEKCLIDRDYIKTGNTIGKGSRGTVRKGNFHFGFEKIPVAIKEIVVNNLNTPKNILSEVKIMNECKSKHVLKCYGMYFSENTISIVLEWCNNGDLYAFLGKKHVKMSVKSKVAILIQIALGMNYLHKERNIVHRDLKSLNVLIGNDRKLKISDFDTSKHYESIAQTVCGTPEYLAPEGFGYAKETDMYLVDIYSFGILIWEVWNRCLPFKELRKGLQPIQLIHAIHKNKVRPPIDHMKNQTLKTPLELIDLMTSCWQHEPKNRPQSFEEVVAVLTEIKSSL